VNGWVEVEETTIGHRPSAIGNLAVGTDLVEIDRIAGMVERYGARFTDRVFTAGELADCGGRPASLAARWAAKEAAAKTLGTGIGQIGFRDIEVLRDDAGRPTLQLHGEAAILAGALGLRCWAVSLAHDGGLALAFVVAM